MKILKRKKGQEKLKEIIEKKRREPDLWLNKKEFAAVLLIIIFLMYYTTFHQWK